MGNAASVKSPIAWHGQLVPRRVARLTDAQLLVGLEVASSAEFERAPRAFCTRLSRPAAPNRQRHAVGFGGAEMLQRDQRHRSFAGLAVGVVNAVKWR